MPISYHHSKHCLMKPFLFSAFIMAVVVMSCQSGSGNQPTATTEDTAQTIQKENDTAKADGQPIDSIVTEDNTTRLIRLTLNDLYKNDISKGLIDTFSRHFKFSQYDLNNDAKPEILVGLTGSFFCGSGGCTVYLLTHQGDVITKFSVVEYPVYVDTAANHGWYNLVMYSGGAHREVKWNGRSYPTNPSTAPKKKMDDKAFRAKLLDWEREPLYQF